ncbi:MAG: ABC transporter substrate-binding protein [Chloroflexi bacterium]|nr:ABC transporter substrate-binding protein [Chloroflexota bacterium]
MRIVAVMILLLAGSVFVSCTGAATPSPTGIAPKAGVVKAETTNWQQELEKTVAGAKREGTLDVLTHFAPDLRTGFARAFREKYGLDIEFTAGISTQLLEKVVSERRAGLYFRDVILVGTSGLTPLAEPGGALQPMEALLVLPEVRDPNAWTDKRLPFTDKEGKIFMYLVKVGPTIVINTELVKPEELKSWRDLLSPQWKQKIVLRDPSVSGSGNSIITAAGEIMGMDFLKDLAKQEPAMVQDKRQHIEWVARGKYGIGIGPDGATMEEFRSLGSPLVHVVPSEGTYYGSSSGGMAVLDRPAHPNAAKLFTNWFLSREGQALYVKLAQDQSRRADVAPNLPPDRLAREGMKYIDFDTDDSYNKRTAMLRLSKEIFAASYR